MFMKSTILFSEVQSVNDARRQYPIHGVTSLTQAKRYASRNRVFKDTVLVLYTLDNKIISSKIKGRWKDTSLAHLYM